MRRKHIDFQNNHIYAYMSYFRWFPSYPSCFCTFARCCDSPGTPVLCGTWSSQSLQSAPRSVLCRSEFSGAKVNLFLTPHGCTGVIIVFGYLLLDHCPIWGPLQHCVCSRGIETTTSQPGVIFSSRNVNKPRFWVKLGTDLQTLWQKSLAAVGFTVWGENHHNLTART